MLPALYPSTLPYSLARGNDRRLIPVNYGPSVEYPGMSSSFITPILLALSATHHPTHTMSRAPSNPFYSAEPVPPPPSGGSSSPPEYRASTRPVPPIPAEPVTYTSLSDLTKGKQQTPSTNTFSYQPSSQRAGYVEGGPVQPQPGNSGARRLPPDPLAGRERNLAPPQRNVACESRSCPMQM